MFNKKWVTSRKCIDFVQGKGFYIILFLCVLMIAGTGIYVARMNMNFYSEEAMLENPQIEELSLNDVHKDEMPKEEIFKEEIPKEEAHIYEMPKNEVVEEEKKSDTKIVFEKEQETMIVVKQPTVGETPAPVAKKEDSPKEKEAPPKIIDRLILPVQGEIILPFAMDRLVYFKTLEQWSTHAGINIRSERGTPVKAAAEGVIKKIYHDDRLGVSIILDHGNGLETKYANLSTDDMVKEGQSIKKGQVISGVGNTALIKSADESHLHFEVIKDGKHIDPETMLP